ncbi:uncharacterized protein LOC126839528 [Adelges cooleyi]|uniref:uncharacterized protein LOC126839528 n=1 Tax=Adelges cooleyi TaxID=133065 RepID=UPI00218042D6|nr:uncharacterized protein LOC126839528 [Adelges cooleyi]
MYANYQRPYFDRENKQLKFRDKLPVYAQSRGVELLERNLYLNYHAGTYDNRIRSVNTNRPFIPEFELPNEEQIYHYEQMMMMSNEKIVLTNFLKNESNSSSKICAGTSISKEQDNFEEQYVKNSILKKYMPPEIIPFYKICFDVARDSAINTKWKLWLINMFSSELRSQICQIYMYLRFHYNDFMQKADVGVLKSCNKMMANGKPISETELFYYTIRDDYLMAMQILQILVSINSVLPQNRSFSKIINAFKLWENQLQKMRTNINVYELSPYNKSAEMEELIKILSKVYFDMLRYLTTLFDLLLEKESSEQHIKDDLLCSQWYLMFRNNTVKV